MAVPADRLSQLPPYIFSEIAQRVQALTVQGHEVLRLDIGSPDGPPPPAVINTLVQSAQDPRKHGYANYTGTPAFRQAVAQFYQRRFGVTVDPASQVLPLIGSKEGIVNLCFAFLNPGDMALVPDIGYPAYARGVLLAGAQFHWMPLLEANHFLPDFDMIPDEVAHRAKLMWLNYPNNPTGAVADVDFYQSAVDFCNAHNILLVSDNPYFDITFDGCSAGSVFQARDAWACAVELIWFSKTYNMGGWRLGAAVGRQEILQSLLQMKSNMDTAHFAPIYDAGVAALEQTSPEWAAQRNTIYQNRRNLVLEMLPSAGLEAILPKGAIYIWARTRNGDGNLYAQGALERAHVSLTPGSAFGPGGDAYVRISLCSPEEHLLTALHRLRDYYLNS